ncbi:RNAse P, Rpr2/Rpp21 subunit [Cordyceps fumosorosea ARSEF 2679]|uniref:RNAse P, Rpr2/Rpp21 subunit n=1 Tax=Cordyceps fumosorosea (strain ARSEF 2679) TaxID=1081104 RepID=A0A167ZKN7_CORFA|nr:RNAse P, Rpr2/Rpp21 subunit [Cordyceps fumosorosea ARSEF 2679]OAA67628.1 RNAse P, Rpr2/Rpp21 subunit [Cordyceps fumosorosea ARSEF 2679]
MAKSKAPPGVQNRHIYTRASYLYQAAAFLATASLESPPPSQAASAAPDDKPKDSSSSPSPTSAGDSSSTLGGRALRNASRRLLGDMRAVTRKALIRQRPEIKRTVCRRCDALLIEGRTCDAVVDNASRGGRKPWADVLVVRCRACAGVRRYPVGEPRVKQVRKGLRAKADAGAQQVGASGQETK